MQQKAWNIHSAHSSHPTDVCSLQRECFKTNVAMLPHARTHTFIGCWHLTDRVATVRQTFRGPGGAPQPPRHAPSTATHHDSLMTFSITHTATTRPTQR
ncbi:hypothetical protein E2C01_043792 [Portunus trituberculatus]|uniref:Uncharacterized protein n=1 Tax=Portunus trituberculatus TaxID=210409 RepID=A0A5B7G0H3_PORTR|nr:hypothetical protein [Portunus trituberculatus]